jgi:hypothetical protein
MSCPYFHPVQPDARPGDSRSAMLPLGDFWTGLCYAVPGRPHQPDSATLRSQCNFGYARGTCPQFPAGNGPDAVRFTISRDDGASLRLYYVIERDHHPFSHGSLQYSIADASFHPAAAGKDLLSQASAYVQSYSRRKSESHAA